MNCSIWMKFMENNLKNGEQNKNNQAPKEIQGRYNLNIYGNEITLIDLETNNLVCAKCSPEDEFSLEAGLSLAFERMIEIKDEQIKLGDTVSFSTDPGAVTYITYTDFFKENNIERYASYYRYGIIPNPNAKYKVVFVKDNKCLIEEGRGAVYGKDEYKHVCCYNGIYLVDSSGLKKVKD